MYDRFVRIKKANRALLFVCSIVHGGQERFRWLYQFAEASGEILTDIILANDYRTVQKLTGPGITGKAFVDTLHRLGLDPEIHAIDVVMMVHGLPGRLCFQDGDAKVAELGKEIFNLGIQPKLRLYYSTACFGATHNEAFVAAGFDVAIGAVGENCNSATEYPTVLTMWGWGYSIKDAIASGEIALTRIPADAAARALGFRKANSDKVVLGKGESQIDRL